MPADEALRGLADENSNDHPVRGRKKQTIDSLLTNVMKLPTSITTRKVDDLKLLLREDDTRPKPRLRLELRPLILSLFISVVISFGSFQSWTWTHCKQPSQQKDYDVDWTSLPPGTIKWWPCDLQGDLEGSECGFIMQVAPVYRVSPASL